MPMPVRILPPADDASVEAAERSLRFRYRVFLAFVAALGLAVAIHLVVPGTVWSRWALASTGWILGFGVPWLGWHLGVGFAGRFGAVIFQLTGLVLGGTDPRDQLWALADLPAMFFLLGWGVDVCLRQRGRIGSLVGRVLFTVLWTYLVGRTFGAAAADPARWLDFAGMVAGVVAVWLPQGALATCAHRLGPVAAEIVGRGLRSAGGWLATRAGIALLILLPSLIYLDLLDLPPLLRAAQGEPDEATGEAPPMIFWMREARALVDEDFERLEIHLAQEDQTEAVVTAIRSLRRAPRDPALVEAFAPLSVVPLGSVAQLSPFLGRMTVFYIDRTASGDDRVTSGMLSAPPGRWASWAEAKILDEADVSRHESSVQRSTVVILAGGVLILLLLGGPSGGTPAAWWLAIYLAGTHIGWVGESLDLVLDRVRFTIWRDYADHPAGATLFGGHTLLLFLVRSTEWMVTSLVAPAGLWVSLCWPSRPWPILRSWLDRFWVQVAKIAIVAAVLYGLRFGFLFLGAMVSVVWAYAWFVVFPLLLVGSGMWWRRRGGAGRALPVVGRLAAAAFLVRGWVPLFTVLSPNAPVPASVATAFGWIGTAFAIVAAGMLVVALERCGFLSPPHVEGQLWLVAVAAIPFVETVVGDPVSDSIENSNLFLGTTVGWLAFAASVWVIGPIAASVGEFLSRWRAKGLDRIGEFDAAVAGSECPAAPAALAADLFADLGIADAQLWRHLGEGSFQRLLPAPETGALKLASASLADALGGVEESLRLEEMRMEWRWAAYHGELDRWFAEGGDLLLIPVSREGALLGIVAADDVPEHRFLLRPAVASALASALAVALLRAAPGVPQDAASGEMDD